MPVCMYVRACVRADVRMCVCAHVRMCVRECFVRMLCASRAYFVHVMWVSACAHM